VKWKPVRREAMKFAPARTPERFKARKRPGSSTFHENFDFRKFRLHDADPLFQIIFVVSNSFCDLIPPNESYDPKNHRKNTDCSNEFTDFEQFDVEGAARIKTMLAMVTVDSPRVRITLETTALRVT